MFAFASINVFNIWVPVSLIGKVSDGVYKRFEIQSLSTPKTD